MTEKINLWEKKHKSLCWVNMQKNLKVYNLDTEKEDFIYSGVRLYQADDVNTIMKELFYEIKLEWQRRKKRYEINGDSFDNYLTNVMKSNGFK